MNLGRPDLVRLILGPRLVKSGILLPAITCCKITEATLRCFTTPGIPCFFHSKKRWDRKYLLTLTQLGETFPPNTITNRKIGKSIGWPLFTEILAYIRDESNQDFEIENFKFLKLNWGTVKWFILLNCIIILSFDCQLYNFGFPLGAAATLDKDEWVSLEVKIILRLHQLFSSRDQCTRESMDN